MSLSAYVFIRKIMKSVFKLHFCAQWEDHRYSFVWLSYFGFGRSRRRELLGTTPCWASSVGAQRDGTCICCWAPARLQNGACSAPAAIDRCLLPAGRSAANPPVGQTDADRYGDPASHTVRATSILIVVIYFRPDNSHVWLCIREYNCCLTT